MTEEKEKEVKELFCNLNVEGEGEKQNGKEMVGKNIRERGRWTILQRKRCILKMLKQEWEKGNKKRWCSYETQQ